MNGSNLGRVLRRRNNPTDAPTTGVGGFGDGVDDKCAFGHAVDGCRAEVDVIVVEDVFVDFIGDEIEVVLFAEAGNEGEFFFGKDFACGVVWGVEDDGACVLGSVGQFCFVELPLLCVGVFVEGDIDGFEAKDVGLVGIHFVKGLEDDESVTRVAHGA